MTNVSKVEDEFIMDGTISTSHCIKSCIPHPSHYETTHSLMISTCYKIVYQSDTLLTFCYSVYKYL